MTEKANNLINEFKINGWQTKKLYERLFDLTSSQAETFAFASAYLKLFDKNATILNYILSYVDKQYFNELVNIALEFLKKQKNENALNVIEYASLQFPELLHDDLELIFDIMPSYFTFNCWRQLPKEKIEVFKNKFVDSNTSNETKKKLFKCLLQTREIETIVLVYEYVKINNIFGIDNSEDILLSYLELVGFTIRNDKVETYCPNYVKHFSFKKDYFLKDNLINMSKVQHPTWNLEVCETQYKFGGMIQNNQKNPFTHLITFDTIPKGINISELSSLILGLHIRELNDWGLVFYQHDKLGKPSKIGEIREIENFLGLSIKETEIFFANTTDRWLFQNWGSSNGNENLFRLGGEPTWIQNAEVLVCPICDEKMDFLMQLDTDLPDIKDGEVYFGNGGICYVFWCNKSKVSGYVTQCT